jgi:serine/threonine protein kinase/WD40 repeat protein
MDPIDPIRPIDPIDPEGRGAARREPGPEAFGPEDEELFDAYIEALARGEAPGPRSFLASMGRATSGLLPRLEILRSQVLGKLPRGAGGGTPGRIGPYEIIRELGSGAQGQVHLAEDTRSGRRVALKVLAPHLAASRTRRLRFEKEALVVSRLDHPGISRVHEAGEVDGVHYIAMEYVEGEPLSRAISLSRDRATSDPSVRSAVLPRAGACAEDGKAAPAGGSPATRSREEIHRIVELFERAARALHAAHEASLIHRDIKPGNILVGADGKPVIVDFGLAHDDEGDGETLTRSGDLLGTPAYMSPEQLLAQRVPLDRRTDIYSLAVSLYECLTLHRPFEASSREVLYQKIITAAPRDPRQWNPHLSDGIVNVLRMALRKDRERRYVTALAFADDLERVRQHRLVRARPVGPLQELWRWSRRNRVLATLLALVAALLVTVACGAVLIAFRERRMAQVAEGVAAERTELAREREVLVGEISAEKLRAQRDLYRALLGEGSALRLARQPGYRARVRDVLSEAAAVEVPERDPAEIARVAVAAMGDPVGLAPIDPPPGVERLAASDPPPELRAAVEAVRGTSSRDVLLAFPEDRGFLAGALRGRTTVQLVDRGGEARARRESPIGYIHDLALTAKGDLLALGCEEGACVFALPSFEVRSLFRGDQVGSVALDRDGQLLAARNNSYNLDLWSLSSNRHLVSFPMRGAESRFRFSPDGKRILFYSGSGRPVSAREVEDTPERLSIEAHTGGVPDLAFSPAGDLLATASKDRTVKLWASQTGLLLGTLAGHAREVQAVAWSPAGDVLAAGDWSGAVRLWEPRSGTELARIEPAGTGEVWRVRFGADGRRLFVLGFDGLAAFALEGPPGAMAPRQVARGALPGPPLDFVLRPGTNDLVVCDRADSTYYWDLLREGDEGGGAAEARGPELLAISTKRSLRPAAFDPGGRLLHALTREGRFATWDLERGELVATTSRKVLKAALCVLAPGGRWVATNHDGPRARVEDLQEDRELVTLPAERSEIWSLDWSPDGARLAVGLSDGGVSVWDLERVRAELLELGLEQDSTRTPSAFRIGKGPAPEGPPAEGIARLRLPSARLLEARAEKAWEEGSRVEAVRLIEEALESRFAPPGLRGRLAAWRRELHPCLASYASADQALGALARREVVARGARWRFFRGRAEPSAALEWTEPGFDDAAWEEGPAGFGYGDGEIATSLDDMKDRYTALYLRHRFQLDDPAGEGWWTLSVVADDGFVAYLNGHEVGRVRAGGGGKEGERRRLAFNALARRVAPEPAPEEGIAVPAGLLRRGENVLAIQGLNVSADSSDFELHPVFWSGKEPGDVPGAALLEAYRAARPAGDALRRVERYLEAKVLEIAGRPAEAAARFRALAAEDASRPEPLLGFAGCLRSAGESENAAAALRDGVARFPRSEPLWSLLARVTREDLGLGPGGAGAALLEARVGSSWAVWDFEGDLAPAGGAGGVARGAEIIERAASGTQEPGIAFRGVEIDGGEARAVELAPGTWLEVRHGLPANLGGRRLNRFTLIADLMFPERPAAWVALWSSDLSEPGLPDAAEDATRPAESSGSAAGPETVADGVWRRCVIVCDPEGDSYRSYLDGAERAAFQLSQYASRIDGRFSLAPVVSLFAGGDGASVTRLVGSLQIRDDPLTAAEVRALGGPQAAGVPRP